MSETAKLLALFRVESQLRGLRSRLDQADRFLQAQLRQHQDLEDRASEIETKVKHLKASAGEGEGESDRLEARIAEIREKMNQSQTSKEYNAFLAELNTFKAEKDKIEESALGSMGEVDELQAKLDELRETAGERSKIVEQARAERNQREADIKDRLEELSAQRDTLAADVPSDTLNLFESLLARLGDEAMAPIEVLDRRNHEYTCGGCMVVIPMEAVSTIASGKLARCPSCGCILYTEDESIGQKKKAKVEA